MTASWNRGVVFQMGKQATSVTKTISALPKDVWLKGDWPMAVMAALRDDRGCVWSLRGGTVITAGSPARRSDPGCAGSVCRTSVPEGWTPRAKVTQMTYGQLCHRGDSDGCRAQGPPALTPAHGLPESRPGQVTLRRGSVSSSSGQENERGFGRVQLGEAHLSPGGPAVGAQHSDPLAGPRLTHSQEAHGPLCNRLRVSIPITVQPLF